MSTSPVGRRFLLLSDVAEILNTSPAQVYALVRTGELPAIKIGGRGQWRVEVAVLEDYIERMYAQTRDFVGSHRFGRTTGGDADAEDDAEAAVGGKSAAGAAAEAELAAAADAEVVGEPEQPRQT